MMFLQNIKILLFVNKRLKIKPPRSLGEATGPDDKSHQASFEGGIQRIMCRN